MPRGNVRVSIVGDATGLNTATRRAESDLRRFGTGAEKSSKRVTGAFKLMGAAAVSAGAAIGTAGLALGLKKAIDEMRDATKVTAQTNAVIKSTGGVANVTEQQLGKLAERLSMVAGLDDELIQRGANMLLSFRDIRNEVGKNNDIFNQATKATLDMAAAVAAANDSEINLRTASIQVGKALNDPIKGMTALSRVGVQFTDQQKEQITTLVESGKKVEAQKVILRELRTEFAGSAKANADATDRLKVAIDNLFEKLGKALAPALEDATRWLVRFINQMERGTGAGGDFVRTLGALADGFHAIWVVARDTTRAMVRMGDVVLGVLSSMSRSLAKVIGTANKVPGIGKAIDDDWAPSLTRSANRIDNLRERLRRLVREPHDVKVNVSVALGPGGREMRPGDGWGVEDAIDQTVQTAFNQGKLGPLALFGGGGSAALQGAGSHLAPFAALGARMGLHVSSGYFGRENSITSSGNRSYHAMRRAIDMADGPVQMLAYAKAMASMFGGSLRELIHTPLGFSIKDGRRVAPYAVADHYDHVHVAMQRGGMIPGQGVGDKVPVLAEPGEGFLNSRLVRAMGGKRAIDALNAMVPRFASGGVVAQAARGAGFKGNLLRTMVAIARAESGWNPGAVGDGGSSIGLWQINLPAHPWARGLNLKNPSVNAQAAMRVYRSQGLGAWSVYNSGAYRAWLDEAAAVISRGEGLKPGERLSPREIREQERRRRERTSVRGPRTNVDIIGTRQDLRHESRWGALQGIRDDDVVTPEERAQADRAYLARQKVLNARIKAKRARLAKINRALRGKLRPATRKRLLAEKQQLISDIGGLVGESKGLTGEFQELVAPFDTGTGEGGGGAPEPDPALELNNRLLEEHNKLLAEISGNQKTLITLTQVQGPAILAGVIAAVEGTIGGKAGLGFNLPATAGVPAVYR